MRNRFVPFLILGVAFTAIGIAGQRAFIFIGIVFLLLAVALMRKRN
jgi:hypothetical protein